MVFLIGNAGYLPLWLAGLIIGRDVGLISVSLYIRCVANFCAFQHLRGFDHRAHVGDELCRKYT